MFAGLVLISAMIGLLATGGALALAMSTGTALLVYPLVCSLSLMMLAAIESLRADHVAFQSSMGRQQA